MSGISDKSDPESAGPHPRWDVASMPVAGGGYGACQVAAATPQTVMVSALAWWSAQQPTLAQLAGVVGGQPAQATEHVA